MNDRKDRKNEWWTNEIKWIIDWIKERTNVWMNVDAEIIIKKNETANWMKEKKWMNEQRETNKTNEIRKNEKKKWRKNEK